jgi:hypothetical protein
MEGTIWHPGAPQTMDASETAHPSDPRPESTAPRHGHTVPARRRHQTSTRRCPVPQPGRAIHTHRDAPPHGPKCTRQIPSHSHRAATRIEEQAHPHRILVTCQEISISTRPYRLPLARRADWAYALGVAALLPPQGASADARALRRLPGRRPWHQCAVPGSWRDKLDWPSSMSDAMCFARATWPEPDFARPQCVPVGSGVRTGANRYGVGYGLGERARESLFRQNKPILAPEAAGRDPNPRTSFLQFDVFNQPSGSSTNAP